MINELKINLTDDKFSNAKRILKHKQLIINSNLEMFQAAEVVFPEIQDQIASDKTLSDRQKQLHSQRFRPITYSSDTPGSFVDAATGAEVLPDENGQFPKDVIVITELEFWQNLPAEFFAGANLKQYYPDVEFFEGKTLAELVYNGLLFSQAKMRERQRV